MRDHQDVWRGQCETVTCSCAGYVRRKSGPSQHRCKQCHHSAAMHSARDLRHAHQVATRVFKEMPSPSKPQARFADKVTIHNLKPSALLGAFGKSGGGAGGVPGSATTTTAATKSRPRPHMTHQIDLELYEQLRSKYQAARRSQRASSLAAAAARTEAEERRARRRRRRGSSSSGGSRGSGSSEGSGSDGGEDSQGGADSLRSAANSVQGNSQAGQGRYSGRGGSTRPSTAGSRPNQGTNKKKKRHMARWSPAAEYYEKDTRKQRLTSELSRITQSMQPAYSMRARTALPQSRDVTPGPNKYDIGRAVTASSRLRRAPAYSLTARRVDLSGLSKNKGAGPGPGEYIVTPDLGSEAPAWSLGGRLKSRREIEADLGYPITPAPGGTTRIPSFAHDAVVEGKGVVFGHKLPVWEDIAEKLGYPRPPAPGGNCKVPSFAEDNKLHNKGVVFGHRWKTKEEIDVACGFPVTPAPGGNVPVPSFVEDAKRQNKGVPFGHRLRSQAEMDRALKRPVTPGPGTYTLPDKFSNGAAGRVGYSFGDRPGAAPEIDSKYYHVGPRSQVSPLSYKLPEGFGKDVAGGVMGSRLKTREDIDAAIGVGPSTTPAPGGLTRVPSFAEDGSKQGKGVPFGVRLKTRREIAIKLGYPEPPAPGGNVPVPSFVDDAKRQNKGVKFGHRLLSRREIAIKLGYPAGPAPGGEMPIPSFVDDAKRQNKGVRFGHKLATREEIEVKLGYPVRPAMGSTGEIPSFSQDNKSKGKGVFWGKPKDAAAAGATTTRPGASGRHDHPLAATTGAVPQDEEEQQQQQVGFAATM